VAVGVAMAVVSIGSTAGNNGADQQAASASLNQCQVYKQ